MNQTRLESLIETCCNISLGFVVSLLFWVYVVVPFWHIPVTMGENIQITLAFTVLAITRGYLVRRFFNAGFHRFAKDAARWVRARV